MPAKPKEQERPPMEPFAYAGRLRDYLERARVGNQVHLAHLAKQNRTDELAESIQPHLEALEKLIEDGIEARCATHPVWLNWAGPHRNAAGELRRVKGLGLTSLGCVLSRMDIERIHTVSQTWSHFGFAPGQKRVKGEKLTYDAVGRTWCWRMGDTLRKVGGTFKDVYEARKQYEASKVIAAGGKILPTVPGRAVKKPDPPDMTEAHINTRALRYMIKKVLACVTIVWWDAIDGPRDERGNKLSRQPYIIGREDEAGRVHQTFVEPEQLTDQAL